MGKHTHISSRMGLEQGICTWFDSQPSFNRRTQYSIYEILSFNLKKKYSFWWNEDNRRKAIRSDNNRYILAKEGNKIELILCLLHHIKSNKNCRPNRVDR